MAPKSHLTFSLRSLSPETKPSRRTTAPSKHQDVADSWDAAEDSDLESSHTTTIPSFTTPRPPPQLSDYPSVPPPTPVAPQQWQQQSSPFQGIDFTKGDFGGRTTTTATRGQGEHARPEKTNAVAGRLIAGALGVKAPRRTEEQRAYDKAMRDKEVRRKEEERERKRRDEEKREKAKRDVWDG